MTDRQLTLAMSLTDGYGNLAGAWRAPNVDPRSGIALHVARRGWSPRDVLAHGVIDYHPTVVGPAVKHADHIQE